MVPLQAVDDEYVGLTEPETDVDDGKYTKGEKRWKMLYFGRHEYMDIVLTVG